MENLEHPLLTDKWRPKDGKKMLVMIRKPKSSDAVYCYLLPEGEIGFVRYHNSSPINMQLDKTYKDYTWATLGSAATDILKAMGVELRNSATGASHFRCYMNGSWQAFNAERNKHVKKVKRKAPDTTLENIRNEGNIAQPNGVPLQAAPAAAPKRRDDDMDEDNCPDHAEDDLNEKFRPKDKKAKLSDESIHIEEHRELPEAPAVVDVAHHAKKPIDNDVKLQNEEANVKTIAALMEKASRDGSEGLAEAEARRLLPFVQNLQDPVDFFDRTLLEIATEGGNLAMAKLLVAAGAKFLYAKPQRVGAPMWLNAMKKLLNDLSDEELPAFINAGLKIEAILQADPSQLIQAAKRGSVPLLEAFIRAGADVRDKIDDSTALHIAVAESHLSAVKLLLDKNVDTEAVDNHGRTALHIAAENGSVEIVQLLLRSNARVDAPNGEKLTALHLAAGNGHYDVVTSLCIAGADINSGEWTPLLYAADEGHVSVVNKLLDLGASINYSNPDGQTALSLALLRNHSSVVRELVKRGANLGSGWQRDLRKAISVGDSSAAEAFITGTQGIDLMPLLPAVASKGKLSILRAILNSNGAKSTDNMKACLFEAIKANQDGSVQVIIDLAKPDPETLTSALEEVVKANGLNIAMRLLNAGASPGSKGLFGFGASGAYRLATSEEMKKLLSDHMK